VAQVHPDKVILEEVVEQALITQQGVAEEPQLQE
jgi:hypothetical protein